MKQIRIAVTGAAGQIGYALLFRIASGQMFGEETEIALQLLELEQALPALRGVIMELEDCAFPLLRSAVPPRMPRRRLKMLIGHCSSVRFPARRAWSAPTCSR